MFPASIKVSLTSLKLCVVIAYAITSVVIIPKKYKYSYSCTYIIPKKRPALLRNAILVFSPVLLSFRSQSPYECIEFISEVIYISPVSDPVTNISESVKEVGVCADIYSLDVRVN